MSANLTSHKHAAKPVDGSRWRFAIVCSRFNSAIVDDLVEGAARTLRAHRVAPEAIEVIWVPGALEIPQVARAVADHGRYDAIIALGAVIKGDTYHFEVVCDASAAGLMQLSMSSSVVVTNGILTVYDERQARVRSAADERNKGTEAALAALETLETLNALAAPPHPTP